MSSLVSVLAKEMDAWPDDQEYFTCDPSGYIRASLDVQYDFHPEEVVNVTERTKEYAGLGDDYPRVTKAMWQAERDRQNGGEWKRHRGGLCPVKAGTKVSTKHRDGEVFDVHHHTAQEGSSVASLNGIWKHNGDSFDIMKYRIISQPQAEEVEYRGPFPCAPIGEPANLIEYDIEFPSGVFTMESKTEQFEGPLAWRDRIIHCQAIIEDCEREIERNVQLLDAEGLMMQKDSKKAMQHYVSDVDMTDYKNWSHGDSVIVGGGFGSYGADHFESGAKVTDVDLEDTECPTEINGLWFTRSEILSDVKRA